MRLWRRRDPPKPATRLPRNQRRQRRHRELAATGIQPIAHCGDGGQRVRPPVHRHRRHAHLIDRVVVARLVEAVANEEEVVDVNAELFKKLAHAVGLVDALAGHVDRGRATAAHLEVGLVDSIIEKTKQGQQIFTAADFEESEAFSFLARYRQIYSHKILHRQEILAVAFIAETETEKKEGELGDVLFSLINYARIIGLNADSALEKTNLKFISRFQDMEELAQNRNRLLSEMSLHEMDELWEEAKKTR